MGGTLDGPGQQGNPWGAPDQGAPWHVPDPGRGVPASTGYQPSVGGPAAALGRGKRGWLIGGIAAVVVLALGCTLLVALFSGDDGGAKFDDPAKRQARLAGEALTAAATAFSQDAAVKYTGTYTQRGDKIDVDARITRDGWTSAKVTIDGSDVAVLSNGARTYLKASKRYWDDNGAPRDSLDDYAKRWVRVPADELGIDLSRVLAPGALAADLAAVVERGEITGGVTSRLNGTEVREILTPSATVYVTAAEPHRIVKLTGPKEDDGGMSPSARLRPGSGTGAVPTRRAPEIPDEFEFDVSGLSEKEVASLFTELEKRVNQLKDSIDSEVTFSLDGGITLKPCTVYGCTATVSMSNRVSSGSPYLAVNRPIEAVIAIRITLDTRTVKRCSARKTMKPNGSAKASCRATYVVPADGRTHRVLATATAVARATVTADIKRMFDDLKAEKKRGKPQPPPKDGDLGAKWKPCDPRDIDADQGGCERVAAKIQKQIGGELHTITPPRGAKSLGPYRGYDTPWADHTVVVKNGRVYDAWTSRYGEPISVYQSRWEYGDVLNFGF